MSAGFAGFEGFVSTNARAQNHGPTTGRDGVVQDPNRKWPKQTLQTLQTPHHRQHLTTTPATVQTCPRCHRPVLYGLAEGLPARVDIQPLTPAGERHALRAGRWTYTLTRTGLVHRDADRRADPTLAQPVLAAHDCPRRSA
jgi:hypothetical protein